LLATMARNKLISHARKQNAACRSPQGVTPDPRTKEPTDPGPSPSQLAGLNDLRQQVRQHLSKKERHIFDLRAEGRSWEEVAAELGGSVDALRMRYTRAVARVVKELGLEP